MQDLDDVILGEGGKRHEADVPAFAGPNAVGHHAMEVHVQVERAAEALDKGDRARSRAADALPSCAESLPGKDATQREL